MEKGKRPLEKLPEVGLALSNPTAGRRDKKKNVETKPSIRQRRFAIYKPT